MPNFGFNPFAPRINVFTTGVDQGDSRRYYSRDVIRTGGERVEIDATLTPGEPGKRQKTQFEQQVSDMVKSEADFVSGKDKKLEFVSGETIQSTNSSFFGMMSLKEYEAQKKEESRREELSRYQLSSVDIEKVIQFERSLPDHHRQDLESSPKDVHIPASLQSIYDMIELKKQSMEAEGTSSAKRTNYSESVDMQANDFISLQRIRNPFVDTSSNKLLKMAEEGIFESHLPRPDLTAVVRKVEEEYAKQHPLIRDSLKTDLEKRKTQKLKRNRVPREQLNHVNHSLIEENQRRSVKHISDKEIEENRLGVEELATYKKLDAGEPCNVLYIRNLPRDVTKEELVDLFGRYESEGNEFVYALLTGRMKGQAFITLPSTDLANTVREKLHGFIFRGKPVLIQFKRM